METSTYVNAPILRGFSEVALLYEMAAVKGAIICGGYARYCASPSTSPIPAGDCDIFCPTQEIYIAIKSALVDGVKFEIRHENHVSLTLSAPESFPEGTDVRWKYVPTPQIIKPVDEGRIMTTGDVQSVLDNFDFTIVRAAIISPTECLVDADFEKDESHKLLRIKNIHCPISSMLRCMKYARKGYFMRPIEALKLFNDWMDRGDDYRSKMIELFNKSTWVDEQGKQIEMSQKEIDELEALLRID